MGIRFSPAWLAALAAVGWIDATVAQAADAKLTESGKPPAASDTLQLYYGDDPDGVNALIANDSVSDAFMRLVYEPMADRDWKNPDQWNNILAESIDFDEKTLEFTIKIKKGIKWHPMKLPNGTLLPEAELTARDVKFTFDCILNPFTEAATIRSYYEDPEATDASQKIKIEVKTDRKDPYLIKIKWKKPYFLAKEYTVSVPIIPRHVYSVNEKGEPISFDFSSKEFADGFNEHWANDEMCGTGPMMFT
ncbi:MAG TPA: ABC transporter substrate-binding protein, partial [Pirellulales bacterium]